MENIHYAIDFILNLNQHLVGLVDSVGGWTYLILFVIIFAETGLIIMPFLPGDSLLFVAGSVCAISDSLNVNIMAVSLIIAGILGNTVNYSAGRWFGRKLFSNPNSKIFNHQKLDKAHIFYEKYGGLAVVISRFLAIVRTFVPFVAGMAEMTHTRFTFFNAIGAVLWVVLFVYGGYFFGQIKFIQDNFGWFIIGILIISLIPLIIELIRNVVKK